jgi:hypothetical protein
LLVPLVDKKPIPLLSSAPFQRGGFTWSADGNWIAYDSEESGHWEVWVASFPKFTNRRQVSNSGGATARWRKDGKELYYLTLDGKMMAVDVKIGSTMDMGVPRFLFQTRTSATVPSRHDVTSDGQRFLLLEPPESETVPPITVITNWTSLLKR